MDPYSAKSEPIRKEMSARGIDLLLVYASNKVAISFPSYLYYLTGFRALGPHGLLFFHVDRRDRLLVSSEVEAARARNEGSVRDVRATDDFAEATAAYLKESTTSPGRTRIVGADFYMESSMLERIQRRIGCTLESGNSLFEAVPVSKEETDLARRVAGIADAEFRTALEVMKVGMTEYELSAELEYVARMRGADDNFTLLSSERHNMAMHEPTDKRLQRGDVVIFEISPTVHGMTTQICRTIVLGDLPEIIGQKYKILQLALSKSLAIIKPGVLASEIARVQNQTIGEAGYAQYCRPPFMRARGHGFGVANNPIRISLSENSKVPLKEGMSLVAHPNQYFPETGYMALGDPVLVTKTGYERLTTVESSVLAKEID